MTNLVISTVQILLASEIIARSKTYILCYKRLKIPYSKIFKGEQNAWINQLDKEIYVNMTNLE